MRSSVIPFVVVILFVLGLLVVMYTRENVTTFTQNVAPPPVLTFYQPAGKVVQENNPIPSDSVLEGMSVGSLSDLYHGYIMSTQALCSRVLRMGSIGDGGWDVCDDPRYKPDQSNCLVYSMGIANDFTYDDAIEQYGCEVHSYDPSMTEVEDHTRGQKVHFHQVGIGGKNQDKAKGRWALYTLGTLRIKNGHEPAKRRVDIVKMDVEGAEVPSLLKAVEEGSLNDVRQLSYEIHMYTSNSDPVKGVIINHLKILRQLFDIGFRIYHTTRNSVPTNLYMSKIHNVQRTACIEVNLVNKNIQL